ncbi:MAG TPA: hypothetical protein VMD27_04170 [Candidatus Aquilonibacter sp.]|nr:hypothetical protein [Candidatus Aquilonibacter sp.]
MANNISQEWLTKMTAPENQKLLAEWLVAIGTLALAVIAVFQDKIRAWIQRPKLKMLVGEHVKTPLRVSEAADNKTKSFVTAYIFKLLVRNEGSQRAEEVEVFASALFRKEANGTFQEVKSFPRRNLQWPDSEEVFVKAISPGMQRECNLFVIVNPAERAKAFYFDNPNLAVPTDQTVLAFQLKGKPYAKTYCFGPGTYRVVLHIAATNTRPQEIKIEINHTGKWFDDEVKMLSMGEGLQIV